MKKWMVWNAGTLIGFVISIVLLMIYLVIRENHRLFRWRNGPKTTIASEEIRREEAKARLSVRGWIGIVVVASVLSLGVAIISPYLWQTVPRERGEEEIESAYERREVDCENYSGCSPPKECQEEYEKKESPEPFSQEQMEQVIEQVAQFAWLLFIIVVLLIGSYFSFGRPSRRLFFVRHFRDPLWPISTTKEIENQWNLILIALADLGVHDLYGSAQDVAERALPKLKEATGNSRKIPGLIEAAKIRDRVRYGLGVDAGDLKKMKRFANWVYDSVWNRLDNQQQIRSLFRRKIW